MGQYRQWLHYRRVDRRLHAQKEQLTGELTRLREAISDSDTHSLVADNHIIQALMLYAKVSSTSLEESRKEEQETVNGQFQGIVSQVLFEHNKLSDFDQIYEKDNNASISPQQLAHTNPSIPCEETNSSSKVTSVQADEQTPTEPQVALPWWLQKAALSATQSNSLDAQSMRTNHLVQRWLERWGRQEEHSQPPDVDVEQSPFQQERQSS